MKMMWRSRTGDRNSSDLSDICLEVSGGFIDLGLGSLEASIGGRQGKVRPLSLWAGRGLGGLFWTLSPEPPV